MLRCIRASARRALAPVAVLGLVAAACTDGRDPLSLPRGDTRLTLRPVFLAQAGMDEALPVNIARITILDDAGTVLEETESRIASAAPSWTLSVSFPLPAAATTVRARIELIREAGAQRTVEWSGQTEPLPVRAGESAAATVHVGRGPVENIDVTAVTVPEPSGEIVEGDSLRLTPAVAGTTDARVYWRSLTPDVAQVSSTGTIMLLQPGIARIEAQAGQPADTLTLNVQPRAVAIRVTPAPLLLESLGEELRLNAVAVDPRGAVIAGRGVSWTAADTSIVRVTAAGLVARRNGTTSITFRTGGSHPAELVASVQVLQRVSHIRIEQADIRFGRLNGTQQLSAVGVDAGGSVVTGAAVSWASSAPTVVLMEPNGVARATGNGTARIIAAVGTVATEAQAVVRQVPVRVQLPADTLPVSIGTSPRIPVLAVDSGGTPIPSDVLTWSLANASIATIAADGTVTPIFPGIGRLVVGSAGAAADTALLAITTHACPAVMSATPNNFQLTTRAGFTHEDFTGTTNNGAYRGEPVVYSGGLMYATSADDVVTGWDSSGRWFDLRESGVCVVGSTTAPFHAIALVAADSLVDGPDGIAVVQEVLAWNDAGHRDYVLYRFTIANIGEQHLANVHFGQAWDFDRLADGALNDVGRWNATLGAAEIVNGDSVAHPSIVGFMPVGMTPTGYALVSVGGAFAGATRGGYYGLMSGGIRPPAVSNPVDVRQLIGVGGFALAPGQRRVVYYALVGGENRAQFNANAAAARARAQQLGF